MSRKPRYTFEAVFPMGSIKPSWVKLKSLTPPMPTTEDANVLCVSWDDHRDAGPDLYAIISAFFIPNDDVAKQSSESLLGFITFKKFYPKEGTLGSDKFWLVEEWQLNKTFLKSVEIGDDPNPCELTSLDAVWGFNEASYKRQVLEHNPVEVV